MQPRRRFGAVGAAAAALVLLAVAIPAGHAARTGGAPALTAIAKPDGTVHATWTVPAGTKMEEFLYDQTGAQADTGTLAPGAYGCGSVDTWCWPDRGVPLKCYFLHSHGDGPDCPGHQDVGDTQSTIDVGPLAKGTYFLQVTSLDQCVGESGPCPEPWEYWSNVVKVTVNAAKSGGSSGGGSSGSGSGGKTGGTVRVAFTQTVRVTHADGTTGLTKSTVLLPGDLVRSFGSPTHLSVRGGALVLDRQTAVTFEGTTPAPVWTVDTGQAYYRGTTGRTIHNLLEGRYTETMVCCNGGAVVAVGPGGDTITAVSAGVGAPSTGPVLVLAKGGKGNAGTSLAAGEQVTVRGKTFSTPKRFVPTRQFWK